MNILTFDLEDWYQLVQRRLTGDLPPARDTIIRQTDLLLELLDQHQTRATFFVLGLVAERYPQLVRRIARQGHEIASHGYAHLRVCDMTREQFSRDTCRSRDLLEDLVGVPVCGYRAPEFSINARSLWALDVLGGLGFSYDSSIFPIHHRRYGIPGFYAAPSSYQLPCGLHITELPLATFSLAGIRAPVAGGGYFRILPLWALRLAVLRHESQHVPMTTYFHPYEFDPLPLDVFQTNPAPGWKRKIFGWRTNWQNNFGRAGVWPKISALLQKYHFTSCEEYLYAAGLIENRTTLSTASAAV